MSNLKKSFLQILVLSLCVWLGSCSSQFAKQVRKVTYPPDFNYTEQGDLRSDMDNLAQQLVLLELALENIPANTTAAREDQRELVLGSLREISKIASRLKAGNAGANHPFMDDYMSDFIAKVDTARNAASIEPPRYYYAGKVAGGCTNCHKVNR